MSDKENAILSKIRSVSTQDLPVADRVKAIEELLSQLKPKPKPKADTERKGGKTSQDRGNPSGKDRSRK